MSVKRVKDLKIKDRGFVTAIVGNNDDVFLDDDLCRYTFQFQLSLYLRSIGYEYVFFYNGEKNLYTYDGQDALQWLFPENANQGKRSVGDGRLNVRIRKTYTAPLNPIEKQKDGMGRPYWHVNYPDTTFITAFLEILRNSKHPTVFCFTSSGLKFEGEDKRFLDGLVDIQFTLAASCSKNKVLIQFNAKDKSTLLSSLNNHRNQGVFYKDFFLSQFKSGENSLREENVFEVGLPDEKECENWVNYQRIVEHRLSNDDVFSFPYKTFVSQVYRKRIILNDLEKRVMDANFIDSLRVHEFSKEYLKQSLSMIHGQQDNMAILVDRVVTWVRSLRYPKKRKTPLVMMFAGPTGTGKTFTAEMLAAALQSEGFGELVELQMSEYKSEADVNTLKGSPPGYVGYGVDSPLISAWRKSQKLVILFDEIEKAHSTMFDAIMGLMDKGIFENGQGQKFDFSQCIIILTTNLYLEGIRNKKEELKIKGVKTGSPEFENEIKSVLQEKPDGFRAEICNRINTVLVYDSLGVEDITRIAIEEIRKLGEDYDFKVNNIPESVLLSITDEVKGSVYGTRTIKKTIVPGLFEEKFQNARDGFGDDPFIVDINIINEQLEIVKSERQQQLTVDELLDQYPQLTEHGRKAILKRTSRMRMALTQIRILATSYEINVNRAAQEYLETIASQRGAIRDSLQEKLEPFLQSVHDEGCVDPALVYDIVYDNDKFDLVRSASTTVEPEEDVVK